MSDYSHLRGDISNDFASFGRKDKEEAIQNLYKKAPALISIVRDDGMRCCYKFPCKCLSTFVCFSCCQDGAHIYSGSVPDEPEKEVGRPYNLPAENLLGSVVQPVYGGYYRPTLHLRSDGQTDDSEPFGKVTGPCCFGGWSEMCFDFKFGASFFNSEADDDIAVITKKKPASLAGGFTELFSNSDVYTIQFKEGASLTPAQKLTVLSAQLLADYMFFENNTEKCKNTDSAIYCYCFYCNILGALIPCQIVIPKNRGN